MGNDHATEEKELRCDYARRKKENCEQQGNRRKWRAGGVWKRKRINRMENRKG